MSPDWAPGTEELSRLSTALSGLTRELYGRGPERARAFAGDGDFLFVVFEGGLTTIEQTLLEAGDAALVRGLRQRFDEIVRPRFAAEVERILGRRVVDFHSQFLDQAGVTVGAFVLAGD
jgi:uncharacterized protein YbcI